MLITFTIIFANNIYSENLIKLEVKYFGVMQPKNCLLLNRKTVSFDGLDGTLSHDYERLFSKNICGIFVILYYLEPITKVQGFGYLRYAEF